MRIFVIGSGGREHALVWKLGQSPLVSTIFVAPGNGGTAQEKAVNVALAAGDIPALVAFAQENAIDLVVPGPELPLTEGVVDAMTAAGIACFGPDKYCAQLEGSKAFAKSIMQRGNVPTAECAVFTDYAAARAYVQSTGAPLVIKADGLAAGKGVVVAMTDAEALAAVDDIMRDHAHGKAGDKVVIEEFLVGEEASFLCFCDGTVAVPLPSAQDHKAAWDGDKGPNTGGMGAYSPAPILSDAQASALVESTIMPILRVLAADGHPFKGVLYAGLMMTAQGAKVLEYNTRFGDPECQPLLMRLESDIVPIMQACINGTLAQCPVRYSQQSALGVVLAAKGYPASYPKAMPISGIADADALQGVKVFHSGTSMSAEGVVSANGGRVLCVTALGDSLADAQARAYQALEKITMPESQHRTDIGAKGIRRLAQGN